MLDLLLNRDNPRHTQKENQADVIEYLLKDEEVYNLARHMSAHGINPLEVVAVFPDANGNFVVAEGNRRVCAAQLLTDPDKAPESARARFRALSAKSRDVSEINIARFSNYETAQPWLQVLHDGEQDGVGRKRWKPEQKARATLNKSTDALAVALLDYGESTGILDEHSRKTVRVSTATRYLANPAVRRAMGIVSTATSGKIETDVPSHLFERVVARFFADIASGKLNSRSVTKDWVAYAEEIDRDLETSKNRIKPDSALPANGGGATPSRSAARKVKIDIPKTHIIIHSNEVAKSLNDLGSTKLSSLYRSLTTIKLDDHPALITTGAWMFIEILTALHGKINTDFPSYVNGRMNAWNTNKDTKRDIGLSLNYISSHGNAEKHSATFTAVDARNLAVHFQVLESTLIRLIKECAERVGK